MTQNGDDRKRILDELRQRIAKADEARTPEFLSSHMGSRKVSFGALLERIIAEFHDEHHESSTALQEADTETKKLKLLLGTVDYVLSVESVALTDEDKAKVMRRAYAEIFRYGPLDALFQDEQVTTIVIDGADKLAVRRGHGDVETVPPLFEDESHLRRIIARLLRDAGAEFDPGQPIMEVGLEVDGRPVAVNLALPPVTLQIHADIRVHPRNLPTLGDLVDGGVMSSRAADLLRAIAQSPHGFIIVGDTESGKTTLMSIMAHLSGDAMVAVERSGELRLPDGSERLVVTWQAEQDNPFGGLVRQAVEKSPASIVVDEVRADEPQAIVPLLSGDLQVRQMWIFRGPSDTKRLTAALGMVARRGDMSQGEALLHALYERLPFVIGLRRFKGSLRLRTIAEWQFEDEDSVYPNFIELISPDGDSLINDPVKPLDLPGT